jgi:hypothetical protein
VIAIPVTIANEGARAGTVLSLDLEVRDPKGNQGRLPLYAKDWRSTARGRGE